MNVAFRQRHQGKFAECEQTLKTALNQMGTDRIARADAVNALAEVLFREKKFQESKIYFEQVTDLYRELFGERHYKLVMRNGLALRRKAYETT